MSRPLSATVYGSYDMPSMRLYERIALELISACRKYVVAATGSSPFKVRDNQRPERTMSGVENLRLSVPSPAKNCPGEVGGINCGGDMGVRRCLARSLTSLALLRTPKSANGPRSNSFRPDSPLHNQLPTGTEDSGEYFCGTGHGPFRALIVSNLKWGGPCRGHYVFPAGRYQL